MPKLVLLVLQICSQNNGILLEMCKMRTTESHWQWQQNTFHMYCRGCGLHDYMTNCCKTWDSEDVDASC